MLYLLQLVQALKFEHEPTPSKRSRRRDEPSATDVGDSGLAQFLIDRAVANPIFATKFHWYLGIECNFHTHFGKMFTEVGFRLQTKLGEVSHESAGG
jgi:phosphatidylinositol 3-kinase